MVIVTKHYADPCDKPRCLCDTTDVYLFLRDGRETTEATPKPYLNGTITECVDLGVGGIDVRISVDDTIMPLDDEDAPIVPLFDDGSDDGTLCDPLCAEECDWMSLVLRMIEWAGRAIVNRHYQLYNPDEPVENGVFLVPRIPFDPSYHLVDVRITCYVYDVNTTGTFQVKVGSTVIAQFTGNLANQRQLSILVPDLLNDELPELHITGLTNGVYGLSAKGLVLEFIGTVA